MVKLNGCDLDENDDSSEATQEATDKISGIKNFQFRSSIRMTHCK
jgi:hypothetical protein